MRITEDLRIATRRPYPLVSIGGPGEAKRMHRAGFRVDPGEPNRRAVSRQAAVPYQHIQAPVAPCSQTFGCGQVLQLLRIREARSPKTIKFRVGEQEFSTLHIKQLDAKKTASVSIRVLTAHDQPRAAGDLHVFHKTFIEEFRCGGACAVYQCPNPTPRVGADHNAAIPRLRHGERLSRKGKIERMHRRTAA